MFAHVRVLLQVPVAILIGLNFEDICQLFVRVNGSCPLERLSSRRTLYGINNRAQKQKPIYTQSPNGADAPSWSSPLQVLRREVEPDGVVILLQIVLIQQSAELLQLKQRSLVQFASISLSFPRSLLLIWKLQFLWIYRQELTIAWLLKSKLSHLNPSGKEKGSVRMRPSASINGPWVTTPSSAPSVL